MTVHQAKDASTHGRVARTMAVLAAAKISLIRGQGDEVGYDSVILLEDRAGSGEAGQCLFGAPAQTSRELYAGHSHAG